MYGIVSGGLRGIGLSHDVRSLGLGWRVALSLSSWWERVCEMVGS